MPKSKTKRTKAQKVAGKNNGEMCWHFPILDHGESEGLNDPLLQYFGGDHSWYVAREIIQNSIDARSNNDAPVTVKFAKIIFPTKEIPGMKELRERIKVCLARAKKEKNEKAEKHYKEALAVAESEKITVLRASDFNTTGLTGDDEDKDGKWHRLVKAIGENQPTGVGGGSYGIGKGAPFVASKLRSVYYSTKNKDGGFIFQGKARLMSHEWERGEHRGIGFYGIKGYESIRKISEIPPEFKRSEQGTDVNIIGYGIENGWMKGLAESVLENFWMAVHCGDLEVSILDAEKEISINRTNLADRLNEFSREKGLPYYRTVIAPTRVEKKPLPMLGVCSLYIKQEDGFPKDVVMMRKPKMKVDSWKFRKTLQDTYAGVFVCEDDKGNALLRGLEPPEHDKWNESLDHENGKKIILEITEWVRGILQEMAAQEGGDPEDIPELDKFLPYDEDSEKEIQDSKARTQPSGELSKDESSEQVGAEREEEEDLIEEFVRKPAGAYATVGRGPGSGNRHGKGGGEGNGGGTGGDEGDQPAVERINTANIKFRIICAGTNGNEAEYCLIIDPLTDQDGAINIVAVGDDAAVYAVPISSASSWEGKKENYKTEGSYIHGLHLEKSKPVKIRLLIKSKARYALGIENYEG